MSDSFPVPTQWDETPWLDAIESASARIVEVARAEDLATPVGHLNRWKVRDVVAHLGGVHEWATRIVTNRSMDGPGARKSKLDGPELCDWFERGVAELVETLRTAAPHDSCPNFNPGSERVVGWWARRQAHETTVHRWDVEAPFEAVTPIPDELAADGVDEFLDVFVRTRGKQTLEATLVLSTTEPDHAWTLRPAAKPGRIDVASGRPEPGEAVAAEASGEADRLLLALWGRLSVDEANLVITGHRAVAGSLLEV